MRTVLRQFRAVRQLVATAVAFLAALLVVSCAPAFAGEMTPSGPGVDTALVVSIDVSSSVNEKRFNLQLEGIAKALEDREVINSILGGPAGQVMISVVTWADHARIAVPFTLVKSQADATALAAKVRALPQQDGEFTCLAKMMRFVADKVLVRLPVPATKTIIDVSGDGSDNCNSGGLLEASRTDLVNGGATINGLPILEGETAADLEQWYEQNVIGGIGAFLMPAAGYDDFARAFRQKFLIEMSQLRDGD